MVAWRARDGQMAPTAKQFERVGFQRWDNAMGTTERECGARGLHLGQHVAQHHDVIRDPEFLGEFFVDLEKETWV